jgi:hypothetical protein
MRKQFFNIVPDDEGDEGIDEQEEECTEEDDESIQ